MSAQEHVCRQWNADSFCISCGLLPVDGNPAPLVLCENVLACPYCQQEMVSPAETLPLHMDQGALCIGSGTEGALPKFGTTIQAPLTIPAVDQLTISEILAADTCLSCGGTKSPGQTLCAPCHGALPLPYRKCLPDHVKGYLFVDDKRELADGISKKQFMDVFRSALEWLAKRVAEKVNHS